MTDLGFRGRGRKASTLGAAAGTMFLVGLMAAWSCGNALEDVGKATNILRIINIVGEAGDFILSDQQLSNGTVCNDNATVNFKNQPKSSDGDVSDYNDIVISDYAVQFIRKDGGANVEGVTVPYSFAGGFTVTVPADGTASVAFVIVRHNTKLEPPISDLCCNGAILTLTAVCTFYGTELGSGENVVASGSVEITFANYGDDLDACP